jgi:hypothetical protein
MVVEEMKLFNAISAAFALRVALRSMSWLIDFCY